ncbi:hypothetical protein V5799_027498 [Amblyomma americanum]|uniref:Uncharacterized protein n=1 Tax=Amblyomma americanum TaxID=6943 RepID=A0AAQ4DFJ5_AMBAM
MNRGPLEFPTALLAAAARPARGPQAARGFGQCCDGYYGPSRPAQDQQESLFFDKALQKGYRCHHRKGGDS